MSKVEESQPWLCIESWEVSDEFCKEIPIYFLNLRSYKSNIPNGSQIKIETKKIWPMEERLLEGATNFKMDTPISK